MHFFMLCQALCYLKFQKLNSNLDNWIKPIMIELRIIHKILTYLYTLSYSLLVWEFSKLQYQNEWDDELLGKINSYISFIVLFMATKQSTF